MESDRTWAANLSTSIPIQAFGIRSEFPVGDDRIRVGEATIDRFEPVVDAEEPQLHDLPFG